MLQISAKKIMFSANPAWFSYYDYILITTQPIDKVSWNGGRNVAGASPSLVQALIQECFYSYSYATIYT